METGKRVLAAVERVNRELGATTAVITHNAAIAAMADRVLQLADGRLVADQRNSTRAAPDTLVWWCKRAQLVATPMGRRWPGASHLAIFEHILL